MQANFSGRNSLNITVRANGRIEREGSLLGWLKGNGHGQYAVCAPGCTYNEGVPVGSNHHDPEAVCAALEVARA